MTDRPSVPWWTSTRPPSWAGDALLALAVAAVQVAGTAVATHADGEGIPTGAIVLLVLSGLALAFRRRRPLAVLAVVFAATFAYVLLDYHGGPIWFSLIVAFFTVQMAGHRLVGVAALAAGYTLVLLHDWSLGAALGLAAWLLLLLAISEFVRARREYGAEETRRRQGEERLRVARELHDVLAHNISLINVRASVGLHLLDEQPEEARAALQAIKGASGEALGELRSVLETLRAPGDALERAPAPGLAKLGELVAQARAAGLETDVRIEGDERPLPAGVELAAYRIVQEALTNVIRHAGPARVSVRLLYGDADLVVQVTDDGSGGVPGDAGAGLLGMRERAAALGGSVEAGEREDAPGFRVRARLPVGSGA